MSFHGINNISVFKRLDTGYVDLYLIHSPTAGKNIDSYKAMLELKSQGLIK